MIVVRAGGTLAAVGHVTMILTAFGAGAPSSAVAQLDPSGRWRTWHTSHFRIHAPPADAALAVRTAAEAERAYALLAGELTPPRGVIDLTLHANVDLSNGFASVVPSPGIHLFPVPPAGSPVLGNYDDWLRVLLVHELTHVFHLDRSRGIWRLAQRVLGRAPGLFPNAYQPSWVSEGLATYYESRLTTAGRVRGGLHGQLLAAAGDRWPRPGDATLVSPQWPSGFRPYAWGSYLFDRLAKDHGDTVVPRFVERTAGQLLPIGVSRAVRQAGGGRLEDAWQEVRRDWSRVGAGGGGGRVLARGLRAEPRPRLSPDGRRLAYVHADGRSDIRVAILERGTGRVAYQHRVTAGVELTWVGSDTLVVAQLDFVNAAEIRSALYRWVPGVSWERLDGTLGLARPFLAGSGVGAVDLRTTPGSVVRLRSDASREPVRMPAAGEWSHVARSAAGDRMAGARHDGQRWDIVTWAPDSPQAVTPITDDEALDDDPRWSADGGRLSFTSERLGLPQVFAYTVADASVRPLTAEPSGARDGSLDDAGRIVFVTALADGYAVVERQIDDGLTPRSARDLHMSPSPGPTAAPPVAVRETGYHWWPALRPHFWLPTWHDAGTAGRFVGGLVAGGDPVGRAAYLAHVAVAANRRRAESLVALGYSRWKAAVIDLSYQAEWSRRTGTLASTGEAVPLALLEQTGSAGLTFRLRRWRSGLSIRAGADLEVEGLRDDSNLSLQLPERADFWGGSLGITAYHLSRPPMAISAERGGAAALSVRRRYEIGGTGWSSELRSSVSAYLPLALPGFAHWVLAVRGAAGVSSGPNRGTFDLGGEPGGAVELLPGVLIGAGRRSYGLRGYDEQGGFDRVVSGAVELRVPLAVVARGVGRLPVGVDRLSASAFAEAASARFHTGTTTALRDVGAEAVLDLAVGYDVPLRARVGGAVPLVAGLGRDRGSPRWFVAFGSSF